MLVLPLTQFLVFTLFVNVNTFILAFKAPIGGGGIAAHIRQFRYEWTESDRWQRAIFNSLGYFPTSSLIALPVSIMTAYFLFKKVPMYKAYKIVFFIPSIISVVVMGLAFRMVFSYNGPIDKLFLLFGADRNWIPSWLSDDKVTMYVLYFYAIWAAIGYNCILLFGAMSRIPDDVVDSARLDGCGILREIWQIYVPIMWPTVSMMVMFGVSTVFAMFIHSQVLVRGEGATQTIVYLIMGQITRNPNYAAFLSLGLIFIAVPTVLASKWGLGKVFDAVEV